MSYCRKEGKDTIIFATAEDHKVPSTVQLPEPEPQPGLILPNGEINWACPCLGGMATGPCGVQFREAFGCFHYSEAEPKGSDCYDAFQTMQTCMAQYPALYNKDGDDASADSMNLDEGPEDQEQITIGEQKEIQVKPSENPCRLNWLVKHKEHISSPVRYCRLKQLTVNSSSRVKSKGLVWLDAVAVRRARIKLHKKRQKLLELKRVTLT
ncbi:unnamed protein product [Timema podura]|uniref:CHCH domain-containing protein n=1 Tax=Timema podura TaxID=61482 RepID=A0ABN7NND4_TIMPD|nr:unnamed protein product [Timema podura]